MPKLIPVHPQTHGSKYWHRYTSCSFAVDSPVAPLVASELHRAVSAMPVGFVRNQDRFFLAAVLSSGTGRNLFVNNQGKWAGLYVPACFRGYPFALARLKDTTDLVLCVDESSGLVNESDGERFFDDTGQLSEPVALVLEFLKKIEQDRILTQQAVDALDRAGILVPWQPTETPDKPETGLYRIDTTAFDALEDDVFLSLKKARSLPLVYAHLFSFGQVAVLKKRADRAEVAPLPPDPADIQTLFGDDDGTIIG